MHLSGRLKTVRLRAARIAALLAITLIWSSCGDVFRPVAIPVTSQQPDPELLHFVFVVSDNGPSNPGATSEIDVSGDSNLGVAHVGLGPSHAALLPGGSSRIFVANTLEDTISSYSPADATTVTTISLPTGSLPVFVNTTQLDKVFVADSGAASVSVIATTSNVVVKTIPVGVNPVALGETPDSSKLYVANQGDNSISVITSVGDTLSSTITDPSISSPIWVVVRSDSARAYVLSQANGNLAVIDTFTDSLIANSISVGAGANFMLYDQHLNRLYITNPIANTLSIFDAAVDPPNLLKQVAVATGPVSVAALPDGSRVYVASSSVAGGQATAQVTVINATDNSVRKTFSLGTVPAVCDPSPRFRLSLAAAADNSRVYLANCDAGNTSIIATSDDSLELSMSAPLSAFPPPGPGAPPPPQNPVFVLAGP